MKTDTHIMVIDDNEDILRMLQAMLRHKGYQVSILQDTDTLEASVKDIAPDIILMDMLLSGADGRELCSALKSNAFSQSIPVIMLSAHPQARTECLAAGANYFIEKPFEMADLFNTVAKAEIDIGKINESPVLKNNPFKNHHKGDD
jgi:DNA-binding response OmpR family regulator